MLLAMTPLLLTPVVFLQGATAEEVPTLGLYSLVGPMTNSVIGPLKADFIQRLAPHEPNTYGDAYPGARFVPCPDAVESFRGACNDYSGYSQTAASKGPLFADIRAERLIRPGDELDPRTPLWNDEGASSLPPGTYRFSGQVGFWHDQPQSITEQVIFPNGPQFLYDTIEYETPPDGWIGNVVLRTQQYRSEGHAPEPCTVHGAYQTHEYAQCHPYKHGMTPDPNAYFGTAAAAEWLSTCAIHDWGSGVPNVVLSPEGGYWATPIFVWRDFPSPPGSIGDGLEDWTGYAQPIRLPLTCEDGALTTKDVVIVPEGNLGMPITTITSLYRTDGVDDRPLIDHDRYPAYLG